MLSEVVRQLAGAWQEPVDVRELIPPGGRAKQAPPGAPGVYRFFVVPSGGHPDPDHGFRRLGHFVAPRGRLVSPVVYIGETTDLRKRIVRHHVGGGDEKSKIYPYLEWLELESPRTRLFVQWMDLRSSLGARALRGLGLTPGHRELEAVLLNEHTQLFDYPPLNERPEYVKSWAGRIASELDIITKLLLPPDEQREDPFGFCAALHAREMRARRRRRGRR